MQTAEFGREANDFAEALATAVKAVESVLGARVVEVQRERYVAAAG